MRLKNRWWLLVVLLLLVGPAVYGQAGDPCAGLDETVSIVFDAAWSADTLKGEFKKNKMDVVELRTGCQDLEWIAENATEMYISIEKDYELDAAGKSICGKCDLLGNGKKAKLAEDPIERDDVVVHTKATDKEEEKTTPAKRAKLKKSKHVSGGWFYYKIIVVRSSGEVIVHDPFVIIQP